MKTYQIILCFLGAIHCMHLVQAQEENKSIYQGNESYQKGKYDESLKHYQEALKQNPKNPIANYNMGNVLYKGNNYADAEKAFHEAIALSSDAAFQQKAYYNEGVALTRQKKLLESIAAYKKSLVMNPADEDARFNLQKALEELRKQTQPDKKPDQQKQQQQPKKQQKQPPPNKKMLDQWLQSLRQKEQEVQEKMQQNKSRSVKQPDKDW